jgi:predicted phosphodiesterase
MLIGVFSDVHDHLDNLRKALEIFKEREVQGLIFCGDFCSPIPARLVAEEFEGDIHLEFEGVKVAVTHYPFYAEALARTGDYQVVFSGHTHEAHQDRINDCIWMSPGDVMGWKGKATCAVYDAATNSGEIVTIG